MWKSFKDIVFHNILKGKVLFLMYYEPFQHKLYPQFFSKTIITLFKILKSCKTTTSD